MHCTEGSKNDATSWLRKEYMIMQERQLQGNFSPQKFELSGSNVEIWVSIFQRTELDILIFLCVAEP